MRDCVEVFIYGSCVSRDFIDITEEKNIKINEYYARSSLASIVSKPIKENDFVHGIESNWQKKMVSRDLTKTIFNDIEKNKFDIFLIDLIDERFNLSEIEGRICTISTEYKKYQTDKNYKTIAFDSDEKINLWKKGFDKLISALNKVDSVSKLRVSRVYWASIVEGGGEFEEPYLTYIKRNNLMLDKMYSYISKYININQFIDYPEELLVAAKTHKWGVQPFHYINDFYFYTKRSLDLIIKKISIKYL